MSIQAMDGWVWGECPRPWCGWQGPLRTTEGEARTDEADHEAEHEAADSEPVEAR